jgi:hypothetical protein
MASSTLRRASHDPQRLFALWTGMLAGPLVWLVLLETNYVLAYVACETDQKWFLFAAGAVAALLVAGAALLAWRAGPAADEDPHSPPDSADTFESRARWMSAAGVSLSLFFVLIIVATVIPAMIHAPCD